MQRRLGSEFVEIATKNIGYFAINIEKCQISLLIILSKVIYFKELELQIQTSLKR